jgi:glutamate synthase domain-containing protein 3
MSELSDIEMSTRMSIDAANKDYRQLNSEIRSLIANGIAEIDVHEVNGHRYIGAGLRGDIILRLYGTAGNDLAAFMDGPLIEVHGNSQDGAGNTMNAGRIIVNGSAGDVLGYAMRGGDIYVRDDVGYRVGIHMKSYIDKNPVITIGGTAKDFLGEYMAGGTIILLNLENRPIGRFIGTGMYGGNIYIRGELDLEKVSPEVNCELADDDQLNDVKSYIKSYCSFFNADYSKIIKSRFLVLKPSSSRPYGKVYAH